MKIDFRVGTRNSRLALIQTGGAVRRLERLLPGVSFEVVALSSPGDRDQNTDLRGSPADFFTRDLDEAVLRGDLDFAVHSAKDLPDPVSDGLDWFWLPWPQDRRDVLVAAPGNQVADLPGDLRIGVSSDRREAYCRARFPKATPVPIRGNLEDRLHQIDTGRVDLVVVAAAALLRLGMADRITEWIGLADLPTPEGQGVLAVSFRDGDSRLLRLRSLFMKAVAFVGAGVGSADLCTVAGINALQRCDVCLHDALLVSSLLDHLPPDAVRINVGKRSGSCRFDQREINHLLARHVRRGLRVVRLKGGDPGIFGRLGEETEAMEAAHLPYRVIPGISSLSAATAGTGMLLTRRGVSSGFCVMSARKKGGSMAGVTSVERAKLPCAFFMGTGVVDELAAQLLADGMSRDTPVALISNAAGDDQRVLSGTISDIHAKITSRIEPQTADRTEGPDAPGLLFVGDNVRYTFTPSHGAFQGRRVLLTCSDALLGRAVDAARDLGGHPIRFPLIRLVPVPDAAEVIRKIREYDWVTVTSPSAVRFLMDLLRERGLDLRAVPRIAVSGPVTDRELWHWGLRADLCPREEFGGESLLEALRFRIRAGTRILRIRSDKAGPKLAQGLRKAGAQVDDVVLYRNQLTCHERLPEFDTALFASGSAVEAFAGHWGSGPLEGKTVAAIGPPAEAALKGFGVCHVVVPEEATVEAEILALASRLVVQAIEEDHP